LWMSDYNVDKSIVISCFRYRLIL